MCQKCIDKTFEHLREIKRQEHIRNEMERNFKKADEQLRIYTSKLKHDEFSAKRYELYMTEYLRWSSKI